MKLHILVPLIGVAFLAVCIVIVFFVGQKEPVVEEVTLVSDQISTTTEPVQETAIFTEEGRQASVPANASTSAPECSRGVTDRMADVGQMKAGTISNYTKESVIQAIWQRTDLFAVGSADCIRTYLRTALAPAGGAPEELLAMPDEELMASGRYRFTIQQEYGRTLQEFRNRMLAADTVWRFDGFEMRVEFDGSENDEYASVYQHAYLVEGFWY